MKSKRKILVQFLWSFFALGVLFCAALADRQIFAQESSSNFSSNDPATLFRKIWSPYCKGVSLLECPSSQAEDLRNEIRRRINNGEKMDIIWTDLQAKYGNQLRMDPDQGGRENLAYSIPYIGIGVVITLLALFWLSRRSGRKKLPMNVEAPSQISKDMENKILKDLKSRD